MSETFVNNFPLEKFHVERCKHCIAVSSRGYITMHGICLRTAEDELHTYSLDLQVPMQVNSGKYDVEQYIPEYNKDFVFQMAGPRSLELVENVLQEDIHDMKFMEFRNYSVLGRPVRVLRMGMGGTLAYEFHGAIEDALPVYEEIIRVGKNYDLKRLGMISYMLNHTENGFPQLGKHFMSD
ncbi:MAG: hypothetical protein LUG99_11195 [Lachnospiraceae bacterium]|nr:hypothetical protein [Lachnospiraceae bacterium]